MTLLKTRPTMDDLPVHRISHRGITIEGYARAVVQSYWRLPELGIGFDLGGVPLSFVDTDHWFITHCHLDHIAMLPLYLQQRKRRRLLPPTIFVPKSNLPDLNCMVREFEHLAGRALPCNFVGLTTGESVVLNGGVKISAFSTSHTVPSLGYFVWAERPSQLMDCEVRCEAESNAPLSPIHTLDQNTPLVCVTGDTSPPCLDAHPAIYIARILIIEMTFVDPQHRRELVHKHGHLHLDDFVARHDRFQNELIIATHLTARSSPAQVRRCLQRAMPDSLQSRLHVWM